MRRIESCQEYFDTIKARFIPAQARGVHATVVYDLEGAGTWTVTIADGNIAVQPGAAAAPTVTYKMKGADFVQLANGDLNGAKAFLTRKLKVGGSMEVAQKMNKFLPPASP
jgi:putative sterol carrier protein